MNDSIPYLKYKSYKKAAQHLLNTKEYPDSVVALAYFAVLQFMFYVVTEKSSRPIDYESLNPLNEDIHQKLCDKVTERLNGDNADKFKELYYDLAEMRHKADYEMDSITIDDAAESLLKVDSIVSKLKYIQ